MRHEFNVMILNPAPGNRPRGVRKYLVHVPATGHAGDTLFHCHNRLSFVSLHLGVVVDTDDKVVARSASLSEELYVPIVKKVGNQ